MIIDFSDLQALNRYHLMTQTIVPRPIAWVLSQNENGSLNLAPFSFFNGLCSDPPLMVMSIGKKPEGELKDTRRNILSGREFVVHIPSVEQAEQLNASAAGLAYEESEVSINNIPLAEFTGCPLPRLAEAKVAYHCTLYDVHEVGPNQQAFIYAEVVQLFLADDIVTQENNRYVIDPTQINPLSRLGGANFMAMGEVFSLQRPK